MINLLPPEKKQSIAYARRNTKLIGWLTSVLMSVVVVATIVGLGLLYINQSIKTNNQEIAKAQEALKIQKLDETQKRVQEISSSIKLVVQVLGKEVLFSKLLQQVGKAMPPDTVLTNLSINQLQGGLDLQAAATNYQSASQVQVNLRDPNNKIFTNADLLNIQCVTASTENTEQATNTKYPCVVSIRAQFAKDNPFSFITKAVK